MGVPGTLFILAQIQVSIGGLLRLAVFETSQESMELRFKKRPYHRGIGEV